MEFFQNHWSGFLQNNYKLIYNNYNISKTTITTIVIYAKHIFFSCYKYSDFWIKLWTSSPGYIKNMPDMNKLVVQPFSCRGRNKNEHMPVDRRTCESCFSRIRNWYNTKISVRGGAPFVPVYKHVMVTQSLEFFRNKYISCFLYDYFTVLPLNSTKVVNKL